MKWDFKGKENLPADVIEEIVEQQFGTKALKPIKELSENILKAKTNLLTAFMMAECNQEAYYKLLVGSIMSLLYPHNYEQCEDILEAVKMNIKDKMREEPE